MLDLPTLGRELRKARRALRIPSAELARRIGVSQTYVWLIEEAKPRKSGEPSRPGEELLERWTAALGMDAVEARRLYELAGYFDSDLLREHREARQSSPRAMPPSEAAWPERLVSEPTSDEFRHDHEMPRSDLTAPLAALQHWAGTAQPGVDENALAQRMHTVLQQAERSGRAGEAAYLLDSLLRWLEFHMADWT